jgi:hypothetical protein
MAGIKDPIRDILAKLTTLQVVNQDSQTVALYARIWNRQPEYEEQGKGFVYPKPAGFLEIVNPINYQVIGQGYRSADPIFRIHVIHEFYDAADGTFEQDLPIFDLADEVTALLSGFTPAGCGPMNCMSESQDYQHTNIYHYLLDFVCNFTNSKGSKLDPARTDYVPSVPPLELEVDETVSQGGGQVAQQKFLINNTNGI